MKLHREAGAIDSFIMREFDDSSGQTKLHPFSLLFSH